MMNLEVQQPNSTIRNYTHQQTVTGRELYKALEISKDYSSWIKAQIGKLRIVEGDDYVTLTQKVGKAIRIEYVFPLDIAKHVCMISRTEKGHQVRRYFVECEKELLKQKAPSYVEALRESAQQIESNEEYIKALENLIEVRKQDCLLNNKGGK